MLTTLTNAKDRDAFGHEIWDYYQKKPAYEIIERDDGYINTSSGPKFYFSPYEEWHRMEQESLEFANGKVLDVGCGAGRVAIHLQNEKKLEVLGIDNSRLALKVSRLRGLRKTRILDFHKIDFPPSSFDTIVMFGNNFGLFSSPKLARRLLRKLFVMTSEDAVMIFQSVDPYKTDDLDHLAYQRRNRMRGRLGGQIKIRARYRTFVGKWFYYLLVSKDEMKEIVRDTGWTIERFFDAEPNERPLYIAILRKSSS